MHFRASMDTPTRILTGLVFVLLAGVSAIAWRSGALLIPLVFGGVITVVGWAMAPRGYVVEGRILRVLRPIGAKEIPLGDLRFVRPAEPGEMRWVWRVFGTGGFFGYYGIFHSTSLGKHYWYASRRRNLVLLRTSLDLFVLSPDDATGFCAAVEGSRS